MKVDRDQLTRALEKQGVSLNRALRTAGVSPNAFFTLQRKNEILPRSLVQLANGLGISPGDLLTETPENRPINPPPPVQEAMEYLKNFVRAHGGLLIMFGSRARGTRVKTTSDWDFGFLGLYPVSILDFASAKSQAQEKAWPYSIDFVDLNRAPLRFLKTIEDDIIPLFQDWANE